MTCAGSSAKAPGFSRTIKTAHLEAYPCRPALSCYESGHCSCSLPCWPCSGPQVPCTAAAAQQPRHDGARAADAPPAAGSFAGMHGAGASGVFHTVTAKAGQTATVLAARWPISSCAASNCTSSPSSNSTIVATPDANASTRNATPCPSCQLTPPYATPPSPRNRRCAPISGNCGSNKPVPCPPDATPHHQSRVSNSSKSISKIRLACGGIKPTCRSPYASAAGTHSLRVPPACMPCKPKIQP